MLSHDGVESYTTFSRGLQCGPALSRQQPTRVQRRIAKWMRKAGLPAGKSFATLDQQCLQLHNKALLARLQRAHYFLLLSPSGNGKTHVAVILAANLIDSGIHVKVSSDLPLV